MWLLRRFAAADGGLVAAVRTCDLSNSWAMALLMPNGLIPIKIDKTG